MSATKGMSRAANAGARKASTRAAEARSASDKRAPVREAGAAQVVRLGRRRADPELSLGGGAYFAKLIEKVADGRYLASLFGGAPREVGVVPEVDLELADACLAEQRIVLVGMFGEDAVIFGALQTKAQVPQEVVVEAPRRLLLKAGRSKLELLADGRMKLSADAVTVDAPREVRLASAHVEIP